MQDTHESAAIDAQFSHAGIFVRDIEKMAAFYQSIMGLAITDRGAYQATGRIMFLSRSPDEHHQLVLATGRPEQASFTVVNQLSFRVQSLDQLRAMYRRLMDSGIAVQRSTSHGNAWSVYFFDPEENKVEVYCTSDWYVPQPFGRPVDLNRPAALLIEENDRMMKENPNAIRAEEWRHQFKQRLAALQASN